MCGIFGFISKQGRPIDLAIAKRVARDTEIRGNHAFGFAWIGADGKMHVFKRPGPASANLDDLDRARDAVALIGHCRWATHGAADDNRNNHPHPCGKGALVHNGVIRNHFTLGVGLTRATECDTEVLCHLIKGRGCNLTNVVEAINASHGPLAILALWRKPIRLVVAKRGNPVFASQVKYGVYFGSRYQALPGKDLREMHENNAAVITLTTQLEMETRELAPDPDDFRTSWYRHQNWGQICISSHVPASPRSWSPEPTRPKWETEPTRPKWDEYTDDHRIVYQQEWDRMLDEEEEEERSRS